MVERKFSTALRGAARRRLELLGEADIVVGIPSYNVDETIAHVIQTAAEGLYRYYPTMRSVLFVSDGGSTDDTREVAESVDVTSFRVEKIVTIYRGLPGKGSAVRGIFEAAKFLKARVTLLLDSDLRSITPQWIHNLAEPILGEAYDFVAPYYIRYRFDGTITNTIAYNLTRALYGKRIRQPIGGDFALSRPMVLAALEEDVWETDVARFGVDIWLTTLAIVRGFRLAQARLGVKIHNIKDPGEHLGPMFRQVVGTMYSLMEPYEPFWKRIRGSEEVPFTGEPITGKAVPFTLNLPGLIEYYRLGLRNFGPVWRNIVGEETYKELEELASKEPDEFFMAPETWAKIVYDFAAAYHRTHRQRGKLVSLMVPLYNARVASMYNELRTVSDDEVEQYFEGQALIFEEMKSYLVERWDQALRDFSELL